MEVQRRLGYPYLLTSDKKLCHPPYPMTLSENHQAFISPSLVVVKGASMLEL